MPVWIGFERGCQREHLRIELLIDLAMNEPVQNHIRKRRDAHKRKSDEYGGGQEKPPAQGRREADHAVFAVNRYPRPRTVSMRRGSILRRNRVMITSMELESTSASPS